jgi:hypothetical protein
MFPGGDSIQVSGSLKLRTQAYLLQPRRRLPLDVPGGDSVQVAGPLERPDLERLRQVRGGGGALAGPVEGAGEAGGGLEVPVGKDVLIWRE